jgi:hypothetical protein
MNPQAPVLRRPTFQSHPRTTRFAPRYPWGTPYRPADARPEGTARQTGGAEPTARKNGGAAA